VTTTEGGAADVGAGPDGPVGLRRDLAAAAACVLLFAVIAVVGTRIENDSGILFAHWPPLIGQWDPHVGPGTPAAVAVAALVVACGPALAARLPWRVLPWSAWAAAMAWTWSLALVDGWQRGVAGRLTTPYEYLGQLDRFRDVGGAVRDFTHHILLQSPDNWSANIAGHPPGAVLTFVGLDRIGLGGGGWAGAFCITTGSSVGAAVLVALRALAGERTARSAAAFVVLVPGAVWVGASADGWFAAVAAWAVALLAVAAAAASPGRRAAAALASGVLFGLALYLSYGLTLMVLPALAVLLCARTVRPLPLVLLGCAVVPAVFTLAGFDWWEGYTTLRVRYYQGHGGVRPYAYWLWGDLGTAVAAAGLAAAAGLRRALAAAPRSLLDVWRGREPRAAVLLPCAFLLAALAADLSGLSKAETERIWLPFTLWLPATAALLPPRHRQAWLAAQAGIALLVNHLVLTGW
jgi:hypothetical protein